MAGDETAKRGPGRPSTRGKDGLTRAERDIRRGIVEEVLLARAEGRKPRTDPVRERMRDFGWGSVSRTRVMDQVRLMGLSSIWTTRWDQLEKYIRRYTPPGQTWSEHTKALHRRQRLALQQAALERPDLAEAALDEKGKDFKQLLVRSGMQGPIWPGPARAALERTVGKRTKGGTAFDRAQARLRVKLKERAAEKEAAEHLDEERRKRGLPPPGGYSLSRGRIHMQDRWHEIERDRRKGSGLNDTGLRFDEEGDLLPHPEPNPFDFQHAIRRDQEGGLRHKPDIFERT